MFTRFSVSIGFMSFTMVVCQVVAIACGRETSPISPTSPTPINAPIASSTGDNTGGAIATSDSTTPPDSSGVSGLSGVLGGNDKNDGYIPSGQSLDWVSVLNEGNFERNVFALGVLITGDDTNTFFIRLGTGFAAGFSNVLWTNAHVVEGVVEGVDAWTTELATDTTFTVVPVAYRGGILGSGSGLSLNNVRVIKHDNYDGTTDSEDVAAYIFSDEPFRHEPLPSLLPTRFADELAVGQPVGTLGFPGELPVFTGMSSNQTVVPIFKDGTISALLSLDTDNATTEVGRQLQYNLTTTGGTSGSPVFDHLGFIIGINHASYRNFVADTSGTVIGVNTPNASYGIRVDALHELIPPVYNSPASVRKVVSIPYPYTSYQPFPE